MVLPGGIHTMLGHWRIILKQAEEAARLGRFDEALALANRPEVADHRRAVQFRGKIALDLLERGQKRGAGADRDGAIGDFDLAERCGAPPDRLAQLRIDLADKAHAELIGDLLAGEPGRVVDRVATLAEHRVIAPSLTRLREAALAWRDAVADAHRGEFGHALATLDRAARLAGEAVTAGIETARREIETRRDASAPRIERLYAGLAANRWGETLAAAEAVLDLVPDHAAAKQARGRAWHQIAALSPSAAFPERPGGSRSSATVATLPMPTVARPEVVTAAPSNQRFLLWADDIGGYLVCRGAEVILGRAGADSPADVPLLGDLSRQHATLKRDGDGYVLQAHQTSYVNGRKVESALLRSGDVIRLGNTVELVFHQPSPISSSARLEIASRHRMPLAVDGVILMAETCILGPSPQAHVPAPQLATPVILYDQGRGLWCRSSRPFEVDGQTVAGRSPLGEASLVRGEGFSFSLEPLAVPLHSA